MLLNDEFHKKASAKLQMLNKMWSHLNLHLLELSGISQ